MGNKNIGIDSKDALELFKEYITNKKNSGEPTLEEYLNDFKIDDMDRKINIIVKLQVPGIHHWPGAGDNENLSAVRYLIHPHRHMFHITCKKEVTHSNRDIEIISFKDTITDFLYNTFYSEQYRCLDFKNDSCEMIAGMLCKRFGLNYCEVLEDGENGAEMCYTPIATEVTDNIDNKSNLGINSTGPRIFIYEIK